MGTAAFLLVAGGMVGGAWAEPGWPAEIGESRELELAASTQPAQGEEAGGRGEESGAKLTVRLKLRPVDDASNPLFAAGRRELVLQNSPPTSLRSPVPVPRDVRCYTATIGGREFLALIENYKTPRVAVDTDVDGNLLEERWQLAKAVKEDGGAGGWQRLRYGPVRCRLGECDVSLVVERDAKGRFWVLPAEYREGFIGLGGRKYRVALVDCDYDGQYDRAVRADQKPLGGTPTDWMAIDRNLNLRFEIVATGRWEIQPLTPIWAVGELLFEAQVEPDGSVVHLTPAKLGMGQLDVGTPDSDLLLVGLSGVIGLTGGEGKWWLPEGPYTCRSVRLRHREAATKREWTLASSGETGELQEFEIEKGQTQSRPVGSPLAVSQPGGTKALPEGGRITPGYTLVDRGGIWYKVVERDGEPVKAPEPTMVAGTWSQQPPPRSVPVYRRPMRFG